MRIGLTGASGLLGAEVITVLTEAGHKVVPFSRNPRTSDFRKFAKPLDLSGLDGVVHLAGEPIFGLWTKARKERILRSREEGTRLVAETIRAMDDPPSVLVSASGANLYPDSGDTVLEEESPPGDSFLAGVVRVWEAEALEASSSRTRVVPLRFGMILSDRGGAGQLLHRLFRLGLGGRVGSGDEWMPWIHIRDAARLILFALEHPGIDGPANATSPNPVTNREFTTVLARTARRPALLPAPAFALRLVLRGLADLALDSVRAIPTKAMEEGFTFDFPDLGKALEDLFGK